MWMRLDPPSLQMAPHIVANPFIYQCYINALMMISVECEIPVRVPEQQQCGTPALSPRRRFKAPWTQRDFLLFVVHQLNSLLCWRHKEQNTFQRQQLHQTLLLLFNTVFFFQGQRRHCGLALHFRLPFYLLNREQTECPDQGTLAFSSLTEASGSTRKRNTNWINSAGSKTSTLSKSVSF